MKRFIRLLIIILLLMTMGCHKQVACDRPYEEVVPNLDLKKVFDSIADELSCKSIEHAKSAGTTKDSFCKALPSTLLATDFVDLQTLRPGKMGILMREVMQSRMYSSTGVKIVQVEFSKYFSLNQNGLLTLIRNADEARPNEYDDKECIVGTYSYVPERIYIFVKRIDMRTGEIVTMVDREVSWSCRRSYFLGGSLF
jgi:hypothetical protein